MHTLQKNSGHNTRLIYDFLHKAYADKPTLHQLVEDNIVNGTQLVELAVAKTGNLTFCPVGYNQDFTDGSDVKTVTIQKDTQVKTNVLKNGTRRKYKSTCYVAKIADVHKKIGVLRIVCWNPFAEKYQYFRIPPSAIYGISRLKISFNQETFEPTGMYKQYEVPSFEAVSAPLTEREQLDTILCNITKQNIGDKIDQLAGLSIVPNNLIDTIDSIKNPEVVKNFNKLKAQPMQNQTILS